MVQKVKAEKLTIRRTLQLTSQRSGNSTLVEFNSSMSLAQVRKLGTEHEVRNVKMLSHTVEFSGILTNLNRFRLLKPIYHVD